MTREDKTAEQLRAIEVAVMEGATAAWVFTQMRQLINTRADSGESQLKAMADHIAASSCPSDDSRLEIAYAIARHLKLEGWPCAYEGQEPVAWRYRFFKEDGSPMGWHYSDRKPTHLKIPPFEVQELLTHPRATAEVKKDAAYSSDLRNLIYASVQFDNRGETDLTWADISRLTDRGWMAEGEDNGTYDITDNGQQAIDAAIAAGRGEVGK